MRATWILGLPLSIGLMAAHGCTSNLVVRKVPLDKRMTGKDDRIDGFRYYTSRPYFVVDEPIEAYRVTQRGIILVSNNVASATPNAPSHLAADDKYVIRILNETGLSKSDDPEFLRLDGTPVVVNSADYRWLKDSEVSAPGTSRSVNSAASAGGSGQQPAKKDDEDAAPDKNAAVDRIRVVYLPDFEEQLAVKHRGQFSTNKFALRFVDGWQLGAVSAQINNTQIPVAALQVLQGLLSSAKPESTSTKTSSQQSSTGSSNPGAGDNGRSLGINKANDENPVYVTVVRRAILEPGMYRLNRTSEMDIHAQSSATGLLTHLGIPLCEEVQIDLLDKLMGRSLKDQISDLRDQLDKCKAAATKPAEPSEAPKVPKVKEKINNSGG